MPDLGTFVHPSLRNSGYTTTDERVNDICRRHPAILSAGMSDAMPRQFCVALDQRFEYHHDTAAGNHGYRDRLIEAQSAQEMLVLIQTIRVRHKQSTHFFCHPSVKTKPAETSWSPAYTDEELNIQRNPDGTIALMEV